MELPAHDQFNEVVEEQTPVMDLVIAGHKRKQHLEKLRQERFYLLSNLKEHMTEKDQQITSERLTQPSLAPEKREKLRRHHKADEDQAIALQYKANPNRLKFNENFTKLSDLTTDPGTKHYLEKFERKARDNEFPTNQNDFPWEQSKRIHRLIQEENDRKAYKENDLTAYKKLKKFVDDKVDRGYTFKEPQPEKPAKKLEEVPEEPV